jgi:hypothetical protein
MPQIFHRSFNTLSKVSIFGAVFFLAAFGWVLAKLARSSYTTGANVVRDQPVPFSHQHHVGGLGIDCRYCHTSVEQSSFAGIPPTKTCMNCHNQIWTGSAMLEPVRASYKSNESVPWNRVHNLADFVFFDHSIHVKKGIGCASCHGRVDEMPLTMQVASLQMEWCLECHRQPERHVRPRAEVFNMQWQPPADPRERMAQADQLMKDYNVQKLTHCSACHR